MKIGIVLVTFNRVEKLKIALEHYNNQIYKPEFVLVVDNCSTDNTKEVLENWKNTEAPYKKETLYLDSNTGGAGGFYAGMEKGMTMGADWLWVSDDDAYPHPDALLKLVGFYDSLEPSKQDETVALCAAVYNGGKVHREHRNHLNVSKFKCRIYASSLDEYKNKAFLVDVFSYVGSMMRVETLKKVGLDEKEYFIYCDDQEHSIRVGRAGKMYCVTDSIVDHDTPPFDSKVVNWGRYYKKRNDLLMIRKNFPFRYFLFRFVRRYIKDASVFSDSSPQLKKVLKAAYKDAWKQKKGLHPVYKPGWKPED